MTVITLFLATALFMANTPLLDEEPSAPVVSQESADSSGQISFALELAEGDRFTATVMRMSESSMMKAVSRTSYGMRFELVCRKIGEDGSTHLDAVIRRVLLSSESRSGKQHYDSDAEKNETPVLETVGNALLGNRFVIVLTPSGRFDKVEGLDPMHKKFLSSLEEKPLVKSVAASMIKGFLNEGVLEEIWSFYFFPRPGSADPDAAPCKMSFDLPEIGSIEYTFTTTAEGVAEDEVAECPKLSLRVATGAVPARKSKMGKSEVVLTQKPGAFTGTALLDPDTGLPRSIELRYIVGQIVEFRGQERYRKNYQTVSWKTGPGSGSTDPSDVPEGKKEKGS